MGLRLCIVTMPILLSSVLALPFNEIMEVPKQTRGVLSPRRIDCFDNMIYVGERDGDVGKDDSGIDNTSVNNSTGVTIVGNDSNNSGIIINGSVGGNITTGDVGDGDGRNDGNNDDDGDGEGDAPVPSTPSTIVGTLTTSGSVALSTSAHSTSSSVPTSSSVLLSPPMQSANANIGPPTAAVVEDNHKEFNTPAIVGSVLCGITVIILFTIIVIIYRRRKARKRLQSTAGSFALKPFLETHRDTAILPVLQMDRPVPLDSAINLGEQAGQIPSQKSRRRLIPAMTSLMSRTAPGVQATEALDSNRQMQPVRLVVDEQHRGREESAEDGAGSQSHLNFVTSQHLDSRVIEVETPPMYSPLQDE